jgi:hypothetical protein
LKALEIINENYFLVMLTEYFAESLYLLGRHLELDISTMDYALEYYTPQNPRKADLPADALDKLETDNIYDVMLYNELKSTLLKQIDGLTDEEKSELREFKQRNGAVCARQRLAARLGLPIKAIGKPDNKAEEYLESKYGGFFKKLEKYCKMTANLGIRHTKDETDYICKQLDADGEYVIAVGRGCDNAARELMKSISDHNREKNAGISVAYMLSWDLAFAKEPDGGEKTICGIPIYPVARELVKNKRFLIAGTNNYLYTKAHLISMGVNNNDIIDWGVLESKTNAVYCIIGPNVCSDAVGGIINGYITRYPGKLRYKYLEYSGSPVSSVKIGSWELGYGIETQTEYVRNAEIIKALSQRTTQVVYTSNKADREFSALNRENIKNYFEVHLREGGRQDEDFAEEDASNPDLIIEDCDKFTPEELAFIIMAENTDFCRSLRGATDKRLKLHSAFRAKRKLMAKLGVPFRALDCLNARTEAYFEEKYLGFYDEFTEYFRMRSNIGVRHSAAETDYICERLDVNGEYIIVMGRGGYDLSPSIKTAYELARSIYSFNREKKANITLPFMLANDKELSEKDKRIRYIPVYRLRAELVKDKKILIADLSDYMKTKRALLDMGVKSGDIVDWNGMLNRTNNVYCIIGEFSEAVGGAVDDILKSRNCLKLSFGELGGETGGETESGVRRYAETVNFLARKADNVIYTGNRMYDEVSLWSRENIGNYFEVCLKGTDEADGAAFSKTDIVIRDCETYSPEELAFIIMMENTDFCRWLRGKSKTAY